MELGRSGRTMMTSAGAGAARPTGSSITARQICGTDTGPGVKLYGADFPRARARRSRATRSASRPTCSSRLGGASPISFSRVLFRDIPILGRTLELGRSGRMPMMMVWLPRRRRYSAAPGERSEVRGRLRYHPDRNSTELGRVNPARADFPRAGARGARQLADVAISFY